MDGLSICVLPENNPITEIMRSGYKFGYDEGYKDGKAYAMNQLEQITRERDAAVKDLRDVCRMTGVCCCCKNQDGEYDSNDCMDCIHGCNWQWRGVEVE